MAAVQQLLAMVTGVLESATGLQQRTSAFLSYTEQKEGFICCRLAVMVRMRLWKSLRLLQIRIL